MRFAIKNGGDEQFLDCPSKLDALKWKHVTVVIGQSKTSVYVDGNEVAGTTGITIKPSELHPLLNYLGRSQFVPDPLFTGYLQDVRIYSRALSAEEVKTVMDGGLSQIDHQQAETSDTTVVHGLDGIQRTSLRPGINIVNGKKVMKQ